MGTVAAYLDDVHVYKDTSKPFDRFLDSCGLVSALRKAGLKRKTKHTIVPPVRPV